MHNNTNPGTAAFPWKTFAYALGSANTNRVKAGDTLVLQDGPYTAGTSGVLNMICGDVNPATNGNVCNGVGANALCGTASQPITIRAEHDRKVDFTGNGSQADFLIRGCRYIILEGVVARSQDNSGAPAADNEHNIWVHRSDHVSLRRVLAFGTNRYRNVALVNFEESTNGLLEDSEGYCHHRHGFMNFRSDTITRRRNFIDGRSWDPACAQRADVDPSTIGGTTMESYSEYASSMGVNENNVAQGNSGDNGGGFVVHGGITGRNYTSPVGSTNRGGSYNKFLGCIAAGTLNAVRTTSRAGDTRGSTSNLFQHLVAIDTGSIGVQLRSAVDSTVLNATIISAGAAGFVANSDAVGTNTIACSQLTGGNQCSFTATNVLSFSNTGTEFTVADQTGGATFNSCNAGSSGTTSFSGTVTQNPTILTTAPSLMGDSITGTLCSAVVPAGSNMHGAGQGGADIGASVVCRYQDGVLTSGNVWNQTGSTTCATSASLPCRGGFSGCGAIVAGINDGPGSCWDFHKALNFDSDGTGCPLPSCAGAPTVTPTPTPTGTKTATPTGTTPTPTPTITQSPTPTPTSTSGVALTNWKTAIDGLWPMEPTIGHNEGDCGSTCDMANCQAGNCATPADPVQANTTDVRQGTTSGEFVTAQADNMECSSSSCVSGNLSYTANHVLTMGCWVYVAEDQTKRLMSKSNLSTSGVELRRSTTNDRLLCRTFRAGPASTDVPSANNSMPIGAWHHAVCRYSGTQMLPFIDGAASGTATTTTYDADTTSSARISDNNTSTGMGGKLDECFMVGTNLTAAAICRICSCGIDGAGCTCQSGDPTLYDNTGRNVAGCGSCSLAGLACNAATPPAGP